MNRFFALGCLILSIGYLPEVTAADCEPNDPRIAIQSTSQQTSTFGDCNGGATAPSVPSNFNGNANNGDGVINLSWGASNGFDTTGQYELKQVNNGNVSALSRSTTNTTVTVSSDGTYNFQLRACNININTGLPVCSSWASSSVVVDFAPTAPSTPGALDYPTKDYDGIFWARWGASVGFDNSGFYELRKSINGETFSHVFNPYKTDTSFKFVNLGTGDYVIRIRACNEDQANGKVCSSWRTGHSLNVERLPSGTYLNVTSCEVPQQQGLRECSGQVEWSGPVSYRAEFPEQEFPPCADMNDESIGCAVADRQSIIFPLGDHVFTLESVGDDETTYETKNITIGWDEYTPPFSWTASSHTEIKGDFDGNGDEDKLVQPAVKTDPTGLMPVLLNDEYIANFHQGWTGNHPQISAIEDWSQESYGAYAGNFNSNPGDELLLLGHKEIILLHGEIITPITVFPQVQNAIVSWNGSRNASYAEFSFDANPADYEVVIGDLTGDGYDEIFLQGKLKGATSYILSNTGSLVQTLNNGYLNIDWSAAAYSAVISGGRIQLTPKTSADDYNETNHNSSGAVTSLQTIVTKPSISGEPRTRVFKGHQYYFRPDVVGSTSYFTFSATGKPSWLSLDSSSGTLTGKPAAEDAGQKYNITLSVKENKSHTVAASMSFSIEVLKTFSIAQKDYQVYQSSDGTLFIVSIDGQNVYRVITENGAHYLIESSTSELNSYGASLVSGYQVVFEDRDFDGNLDLVIEGADGSGLEAFIVGNISGDVHYVTSASNPLRSDLSHGPETLPLPVSNPLDGNDANKTIVGSIPAEFSVKPSGSAVYDVPIMVAPSSGGLSPNVSLAYDSLSDNGYVGVGWKISGLQFIGNCRKNKEQDDYQFEDQYTLCLNGKKLHFNESLQVYQSEDKTTLKVVSDGNGQFTQFLTDGSKNIFKSFSGLRNKLLYRKIDANQNYIEYVYQNDGYPLGSSYGQAKIAKILYTGNLAKQTPPNNSIVFEYESRTDFVKTYKVNIVTRLKSITSYVNTNSLGDNGTELRTYELDYQYASVSERSILKRIEACRSNVCLPATQFEWQEGNLNRQSPYGFSNGGSSQYHNDKYGQDWGYKILDFDGDGVLDYWKNKDDQSSGTDDLIAIKGGSEFTQVDGSDNFLVEDVRRSLRVIDYNIDGKDDAIFNRQGTWHILHAKKVSTNKYHDFDNPINTGIPVEFNILGAANYSGDLGIADFDSDGYPDIYYLHDNKIWLRYNLKADLDATGSQAYFSEAVELYDLRRFFLSESGTLGSPESVDDIVIEANSREEEALIFFIRNFHRLFKPLDLEGDGVLDLMIGASDEERILDVYNGEWKFYKSEPNSIGRVSGFESFEDVSDNFSYLSSLTQNEWSWKYTLPETKEYGYTYNMFGFYFPDLNKDGLVDLVSIKASDHDNDISIRTNINLGRIAPQEGNFSKGATLSLNEFATPKDYSKIKLYFADYNSDGYIDIIHNSANDNKLYIRYSRNGIYDVPEVLISDIPTAMDHFFIDIDGDSNTDYAYFFGGMYVQFSDSDKRDLITEITDGSNTKRVINYSRDVHNLEDDASEKVWGNGSKVSDVGAPLYLVSSTKKMNASSSNCGAASCYDWKSFEYTGLKAQMGRGMLGYRVFEVEDHVQNRTVVSEYRQDFPFTGVLKNRTVTHGDVGEQSRTETTVRSEVNAIGRPYVLETITTEYENNVELLEKRVTNFSVDDFGRPGVVDTLVIDKINGGTFGTSQTNTYSRHSEFYGGRLTRQRTNNTRTGESTITQYVDFDYYAGSGLLWKKIVDPTGAVGSSGVDESEQVYGTVEEYIRDDFGNVTSTIVTGDGLSRRSDAVYDTLGRYVEKTIVYPDYPSINNKLESTTEYHSIFGTKVSETSANQQTTYFGYNTLGRLNFTNNPDGTYATSEKILCSESGDCPGATYYKEVNIASHGPNSIAYFDGLGRKLSEKTQALTCNNTMGQVEDCAGFVESWIYKTFSYNNKGQVVFESRPHFEGELPPVLISSTGGGSGTGSGDPSEIIEPEDDIEITLTIPQGYANFEYDSRGRPVKHYKFDRSEWTTSYGNFTTTITNPAFATATKKVNALGELIEATDADSQKVTYGYDAFGSLNLVRREHSAISGGSGYIDTVIESDHLGRKIKMVDPDKGTIEYRYNAFGELVWQRDNKLQESFTYYDSMGRQKEFKAYVDVNNNILDQHFKYYYDGAVNGLGLVYQEEDLVNGILKDFYYNVMSQPTRQVTTFDNGRKFYTDTVYDDLFRVIESYDASHASAGVRYTYENNYLVEKTDIQSGAMLWQFLQSDALGNQVAFEYGNGVVNLSAFDQNDGSFEIILATKNSNAVQNESYNFDNLGNLDLREDHIVGLREEFNYDTLNRLDDWTVTYGANSELFDVAYDALGNIQSKTGMGTYAYGQYRCGRQAGPHAATTAGSFSYCYDRNGNMISGGNRSSIVYNTNDKPTSIVTTKNHRVEYSYGLGGSRFKRRDVKSNGTVKETLYIGNIEFISTNGRLEKILRHIEGVALETTDYQTGVKDLEFLHRDHLGSIVLITDINGSVKNRFSYDPWGERRNESTYLDRNFGAIDSALVMAVEDFKRGFTGHEHIDEAGLIHMNGRVYDARLARFLSADPFVKTAESLQSFNRYTYVSNNPLNATDPSGYIEVSIGFSGMESFNFMMGINDTSWMYDGNNLYQLTNTYDGLTNSFGNGVGERAVAWGYFGEQQHQYLNSVVANSGYVSADLDDLVESAMKVYHRGGYSPAPGRYETASGRMVDIEVGLGGMLYNSSGTAEYRFDFRSGQVEELRATGKIISVAPESYLIGTGIGKGMYDLIRKASYGYRGGSSTLINGSSLAEANFGLNFAHYLSTAKFSIDDFASVGSKISQKQMRHIKGRKEYRGGGYMDNLDDAQKVLDGFHSGAATIIGKSNKGGFPIVKFNGATGTNVSNVASGTYRQTTNIFMIKGTTKPSIVPMSPKWSPK